MEQKDELCPKCGAPLVLAVTRFGKKMKKCSKGGWDKEAKKAGCDMLVHVGHNKFYRDFDTDVPVLYFPWMIDAVIDEIDFSGIKEHKIGLVTSVQHLHMLDEVDAALDESNTLRFASILDELAQKSQFIVITHNRATMEQADVLYGVTMGEKGISNLLSIHLENVAQGGTARR